MPNIQESKFWNQIIGSKSEFSLQNRALHAIIAIGSIFISFLFFVNLFFGNSYVALFLGIVLLLAPLVYFLSRIQRQHTLAAGLLGFVVIGIFVTSFLLKSGTEGPALFLLPIFYFIIIGFVPKKVRNYFLLFYVFLGTSLIIWEYVNPEIFLFNYLSREILFQDIVATVITRLVLTHVITTFVLNTFSSEHESLLKASRKIEEQNEQLQALNDEKNRLLGIMSHDLRGSLGALQGLTDLMTKYALSEEEKDDVMTKIQMQTRQSRNLLDNMLFWAKNQIIGTKTIKKSIFLEPLIKEMHTSHKILAGQKGVSIYSNCDSNLVTVTDLDYLHLILRNLVQNAVKFTPPNGSVHIMVTQENKNDIQIVIKDSGVGFETSYLTKIGGSRLESTIGTSGEKGTGLGLLLVYEYIELLGAKIECNSVIDMGTTFKITLPAKPKTHEELELTM